MVKSTKQQKLEAAQEKARKAMEGDKLKCEEMKEKNKNNSNKTPTKPKTISNTPVIKTYSNKKQKREALQARARQKMEGDKMKKRPSLRVPNFDNLSLEEKQKHLKFEAEVKIKYMFNIQKKENQNTEVKQRTSIKPEEFTDKRRESIKNEFLIIFKFFYN